MEGLLERESEREISTIFRTGASEKDYAENLHFSALFVPEKKDYKISARPFRWWKFKFILKYTHIGMIFLFIFILLITGKCDLFTSGSLCSRTVFV